MPHRKPMQNAISFVLREEERNKKIANDERKNDEEIQWWSVKKKKILFLNMPWTHDDCFNSAHFYFLYCIHWLPLFLWAMPFHFAKIIQAFLHVSYKERKKKTNFIASQRSLISILTSFIINMFELLSWKSLPQSSYQLELSLIARWMQMTPAQIQYDNKLFSSGL